MAETVRTNEHCNICDAPLRALLDNDRKPRIVGPNRAAAVCTRELCENARTNRRDPQDYPTVKADDVHVPTLKQLEEQ